MQINLYNYKSQKIKKKELIHAINWFAEKLIGKRLCNNLSIAIKFKDLGKDHRGYCEYLDDDRKPRMFLIEIANDLNRKNILKTLAHELVHVKQFARSELKNFDTNNKPIYAGQIFEIDNMEYWDWPWEIEAHGREIGLYVQYNTHLQHDSKLRKHLTS